MSDKITGLHHVTAIDFNAQGNLDFYVEILGLCLVKKIINFDAPDVYHLYYGNKDDSSGSILTFFPYQGLARGRKGKVTVTSFSIPVNCLDYWMKRLDKFGITYTHPQELSRHRTIPAILRLRRLQTEHGTHIISWSLLNKTNLG